jgi:predicted nucleic acid-binding Zn ribbon protein
VLTMGLLSKFRRQDDSPELTCPRCQLPVAGEATECPECGWDLREAYHAPGAVADAGRA